MARRMVLVGSSDRVSTGTGAGTALSRRARLLRNGARIAPEDGSACPPTVSGKSHACSRFWPSCGHFAMRAGFTAEGVHF
jgi:hypothetical protein